MEEALGAPISILLVDDNYDDVELTREALEDSKLAITLTHVEDGVEALAYLRKQGKYSAATRPDLILLDLNMPRKDGRQVLDEIRGDAALEDLPVVVLTTSGAEEDIVRSYRSHVNCYIQKPVDFNQFLKVVDAIQEFWFTIVKLPPRR